MVKCSRKKHIPTTIPTPPACFGNLAKFVCMLAVSRSVALVSIMWLREVKSVGHNVRLSETTLICFVYCPTSLFLSHVKPGHRGKRIGEAATKFSTRQSVFVLKVYPMDLSSSCGSGSSSHTPMASCTSLVYWLMFSPSVAA